MVRLGFGLGLQLLRFFSYIGINEMAAKFTVATDVFVCVNYFLKRLLLQFLSDRAQAYKNVSWVVPHKRCTQILV